MINGPGYTGQTMLNSFIFDSSPQSSSPHARGALLRIDDRIVEIAGEIDNKAVFGRRCTRGAMPAATDRDLELVCPSVLQRERNVVGVFHEGHDTSRALRVGGPPRNGLRIPVIFRCHYIPFEGLLECGETRHPRQELTRHTYTEQCLIYLIDTGVTSKKSGVGRMDSGELCLS